MESVHTKIKEFFRTTLMFINYILWILLSPSKFQKINNKEIKNIVIISFGAIGELLILTPLISALKKELNCKISFIISKEGNNIFKENPNVSEVIIYKEHFKENILELKKKNFDLAIILPGSFKDSLMCRLAGIKYQIGLGKYNTTRGPSLFFNKNFFKTKKQHVVQDNLDVIRQIGIDNKLRFTYLNFENSSSGIWIIK